MRDIVTPQRYFRTLLHDFVDPQRYLRALLHDFVDPQRYLRALLHAHTVPVAGLGVLPPRLSLTSITAATHMRMCVCVRTK